jgi:hypothetical protein
VLNNCVLLVQKYIAGSNFMTCMCKFRWKYLDLPLLIKLYMTQSNRSGVDLGPLTKVCIDAKF